MSLSGESLRRHISFRKFVLFVGFMASTYACSTIAQNATYTAAQDHQNMMDQLGIKALRPGPNGNEKAPDHANYDETKANPYPNLPDALTLKNGQRVTSAAQWWN